MKAGVDRAPNPVGVAFEEADGDDLRHRVVPGLVIAGNHPHRAVPPSLEGIADLLIPIMDDPDNNVTYVDLDGPIEEVE